MIFKFPQTFYFMKYLFIVGRNDELSVLELQGFFRARGIAFKILKRINNGVLTELSERPEEGFLQKLGGVISFGEVMAFGDEEKIISELEKREIYFGTSNKLNYVVLNFGADADFILDYLKTRFRSEKLKATLKHAGGRIAMQHGKNLPKVSSSLIDERYFIFENNFGRILEVCDYSAIENRDMKKPVRRNELAISPRLAKILINISEVKEGEILLDAFCGIGVILQEALLQNFKVIGIDKDKTAIEGAKRNLDWFGFSNKNYNLINADSSKAEIPDVGVLVSEPQLGELQKRTMPLQKAKIFLEDFENLMIRVLNNLKRNVKGRIVFTAPLIIIGKTKLSCDFSRIASATNLKIAEGPIRDFRKSSVIGRDIIVLKRSFKN